MNRSDARGVSMKRFVEGEDRAQSTLFPERLDDYIADDNPVRAIDAFVEELDMRELGFDGVEPEARRPGVSPQGEDQADQGADKGPEAHWNPNAAGTRRADFPN